MPTLFKKRFRDASFLFLCLCISIIIASSQDVLAQLQDQATFKCGTISPSAIDRQALEAEMALTLCLKQSAGASFTDITYVPIRPHIIRRANGTGGYSMASLNNVMALTNKYFLQNGNGIQFYFAGSMPDYIDNDDLYSYVRQFNETRLDSYDATNALNQYYASEIYDQLGGYANFPANTVVSTRSVIKNVNNDVDMGNRIVPHELGHNFNLLHTHETMYGIERVTRGAGANCTVAGDLVCDTPADPYGQYQSANSNCMPGCQSTFTCNFTDDQGDLYTPLPTNIMSYYRPCFHDFTAGQLDRIQAGLATRQNHTAYTIDAPATSMPAPSLLGFGVAEGSIQILWKDNSNNEMGYFIERSTSRTTGFAPIGGVEPNVISFTDRSFTPNTRYYYRIKPSNATTASTSNTLSIISPSCRPFFTYDGCPYSQIITGVTVENTILSQNSGCSSSSDGYFSSFSDVSGTVTAGQSATFIVSKGGSFPNEVGGTIWVDLNNNREFEASERLFQMPAINFATTFSGSLAIPANTVPATVAMRVMIASKVVPVDPCGSYLYGEVEDYTLVIKPSIAACTTNYTLKSGAWNDPATWSCNQVPTSTDLVQIGHLVTLPTNYEARALRVMYSIGGKLSIDSSANLRLGEL